MILCPTRTLVVNIQNVTCTALNTTYGYFVYFQLVRWRLFLLLC